MVESLAPSSTTYAKGALATLPDMAAVSEEAKRRGPDKGGQLLLAIGGVNKQVLGAADAMRIAGIPIDLNRVVENAAPQDKQSDGLASDIEQLYYLAKKIDQVSKTDGLAEPFTKKVLNSVSTLEKTYKNYTSTASNGNPFSAEAKRECEKSIRNIYVSIQNTMDSIEETLPASREPHNVSSVGKPPESLFPEGMTEAAQIFYNRPKQGPMRTRLSYLIGIAERKDEQDLLVALYHLLSHAGGIAVKMENAGLIDFENTIVRTPTSHLAIQASIEAGVQKPHSEITPATALKKE